MMGGFEWIGEKCTKIEGSDAFTSKMCIIARDWYSDLSITYNTNIYTCIAFKLCHIHNQVIKNWK